MKLFVIPNYTRPKTAAVVRRMLAWTEMHGVAVVMESVYQENIPQELCHLVEFVPQLCRQGLQGCTFLLTIGGDGTMVRAAKFSARYTLPLLGINTGTVGFLTQIALDDLEEKLNCIDKGNYKKVSRLSLTAEWEHRKSAFALNDVVVQKASHDGLATLSVQYGKEIVGQYRADGLIITTPTGSTAYAYAAGGPLIEPSLDVIGLIPICAQNRMNIPLICTARHSIFITVRKGAMRILADGADCGCLLPGARLKVSRAQSAAQLVQFHDSWGIQRWQKRITN